MNWRLTKDFQERNSPNVRQVRRPNSVDLSESIIANEELFVGLYEGTYPGLKLASALAYPIVFVPVSFMGLPSPTSEDEATQEMLNEITEEAAMILQRLFTLRLVVGTWWIWPNWDSKRGRINYELIPNSSVVDIIRDLDTGEVLQIITDENLTVQTGENRRTVVRRKRFFTPQSVRVEYTGDTSQMGGLINKATRNPSGVMPIPFANDVLDNSIRGSSVYGRILSDLKVYHDTDLKWSETLNKFNVKMVQKTSNVNEFVARNGWATTEEIDVADSDLIILKEDEETNFIFPEQAVTDAFQKRLETTFYKIVEGTKIPELSFGLMATGNHASVETDMTSLGRAVQDDRNQIDEPAYALYAACLRLKAGATMQTIDPDFEMAWNDLEILSEETKMKLFQTFADAVDKLMSRAAITLEQLHKMFLAAFPKSTEQDFDTWFAQMNLAAKYKQFAEASYTDALDASGIDIGEGA